MDKSSVTDNLRMWFERWADYVRRREFERAKPMFSTDVVGFGTRMHVVSGLDRLETLQWRNVWPTIRDFQFLTDEMHADVSNDGSIAWAIVPWVSVGFHEDGSAFDRPGRATVIFTPGGDPTLTPGGWLAVHTHISLAPGTPQRSFGDPSER